MKTNLLILLTGIAIIGCSVQNNPVINNVTIENTTYSTYVKPIIKKYCYSCHSGQYPKRGIDLTTYNAVRFQAEKGKLLIRINNATKPMPQVGLMPKKEREILTKWAKNNFLKD